MSVLPLVLVALVSGANPEPVKLAATGFQFVNITPELATFCSEHFAQQLTMEGIRVTTPNEIATMLGFERQKELMGCSDKSTSCLAELANALGVDGLVTGTVGKFGKTYQVNIKVLNAGDARPLSAYSNRVKDEEALIEEYTRAAKQIAPELIKKLKKAAPPPRTLPMPEPPKAKVKSPEPAEQGTQVAAAPPPSEITAAEEPAPSPKRFWWIPVAGGAAFTGLGVVLLADAQAKSRQLRTGDVTLDPTAATNLAGAGKAEQALGAVAVGLGVTALAAGGALWLFGDRLGGSAPTPSIAVGPGGAYVGLSGVLP